MLERRSLYLLLGMLTITPAGCDSGQREAQRDIKRGHLELRTAGLPTPWRDDYAQLLHQRLGVQLNVIAGCQVSEDISRSSEAYNAIMVAEIERRFGSGILVQLEAEAQARHSHRMGELEASQDIARGHLELRAGGLPGPATFRYAQLLKKRLGVELREIGCVITEPDKVNGYNSAMKAEIERRFGRGSLDQLEKEAFAAHAATQPSGGVTASRP